MVDPTLLRLGCGLDAHGVGPCARSRCSRCCSIDMTIFENTEGLSIPTRGTWGPTCPASRGVHPRSDQFPDSSSMMRETATALP